MNWFEYAEQLHKEIPPVDRSWFTAEWVKPGSSDCPADFIPAGTEPFSVTEGNVTLKGFIEPDGTQHFQEEIIRGKP